MKIVETRIGAEVLALARDVEKSLAPSAGKAPTPAPAGDAYASGGTRGAVQRFEQKLAEVKSLLGAEAVELLMADLPQAAVQALKTSESALPVAPGQSPYRAYTSKMAELNHKESVVQRFFAVYHHMDKHTALGQAYNGYRGYSDPYLIIENMQRGGDGRVEDQHERNCGRPGRLVSDYDIEGSLKALKTLRKDLLEAWPEAPEAFLPADENGKGGALLMRHLWNREKAGATAEKARAAFPGYAELVKDTTILKAAVEKAAVQDNQAVLALQARALSGECTPTDLLKEAMAAIADAEALLTDGEVKRETVNHASKTRSESYGETRVPAGGGFTVPTSFSYGQTHGSTEGWREELNMKGRQYTGQIFTYVPGKTDGRVQSSLEGTLLVERLLAARRLYEAIVALAPQSSEARTLTDWMEHSTVELEVTKRGWQGDKATLRLSSLRQDLDAAKLPFVTATQVEAVRAELERGPAKAPSKLGVSSLRDL